MKRAGIVFGIVIIIFAMIGVTASIRNKSESPRGLGNEVEDKGVAVRVANPYSGSMTSTVEVSGGLKTLESVTLSAKIPGRATSVRVREGAAVRAGDVVIQQDTSDLRTQVQQAEAALQSARARLSQAKTSEGLADTQTEAQIAQAQAALDSAKAQLRMVKAGARTQERAQVENAVASAKANYDNAKVNLDRMRNLFAEGAISKQQMDLVEMQYNVASSQYDSAKQQLSLVQAGAREEEIEAAENQVAQAEESLRMAKANRGQKALRQEDIKTAQAGVAQAEAGLAYAKQQLENANIVSPISGTVSKRQIEPGEMANPGMPLMEIVALNTIYFEANVSEMMMDRIKDGQTVEVSVDALPGRKFRGEVYKILPTASRGRQFTARIRILNPSAELKPGMFAKGSIEIARSENAVIIPKDAIVTNGRGQFVYLVVDSMASKTPVVTGFENRTEIEVTSGVELDDVIVILGHDNLSDGVKVNVVN